MAQGPAHAEVIQFRDAGRKLESGSLKRENTEGKNELEEKLRGSQVKYIKLIKMAENPEKMSVRDLAEVAGPRNQSGKRDKGEEDLRVNLASLSITLMSTLLH